MELSHKTSPFLPEGILTQQQMKPLPKSCWTVFFLNSNIDLTDKDVNDDNNIFTYHKEKIILEITEGEEKKRSGGVWGWFLLTNTNLDRTWEKGTSFEDLSPIRLACELVCDAFLFINDSCWEGPAHGGWCHAWSCQSILYKKAG